jgi:hypothetical protein
MPKAAVQHERLIQSTLTDIATRHLARTRR